jgi:teichuronic acid biosynthesis glycosyltransferase TuaG
MNVSVIIPAYKAALTIGRTLASITTQSLKPTEVIVVDDGSEDGTFEAAEALKGKMNGIELKVFSQKNLGAGAARNRAIKESTGDWLAFLDADDEWLPEKLAISMNVIEKKNLTLFAHNYISIDSADEILVDCAARYHAADDPYIGLYRKGFIATSTVVVRREAVVSAGGFDETLATAQDFDLWLKILKKKEAIFQVAQDALTHYYISPGSITSHTKRRLDCSLRIARRHAISKADLRYRIIAVHYEAIRAALSHGQLFMSIRYLLVLPGRWLAGFF